MMKPYSSYEDTNIEWLGQIPSLWEVLPLKRVINKFVDYRGHTPNKTDSGILLITARNIRDGHLDFYKSREYIAEEDYDSWMVRGIPEKGDVMVTTEAPLGAIAQIESENVALAQRLILLKANKNRMDNTFIKYYFLSQFGQNVLLSEGTGSTAIGIKASKFYNINIIIPPISEQQAIADFLDRKTAQINTLIEKKQRQIDLLQEQRTALINHAVTKGLNPDAPMKDSGVEWLGEIPSHWEVKKLKYVGQAVIGLTYSPENVTDEENGTLVLRASNVYDGKIVFDDNVFVKMEIPERLITKVGDILICVRSGSRDLIGKNALIDEKSASHAFGAFMTVFRSDINYFLSYVFRSQLFKVQSGLFNTSTVNQLTQGNLYSFQIPVPPIDEQEDIIQFLSKELFQVDETTNRVAKQIELLQEYRTALISEAVTGKIDVRTETVHE